MDIFVNALENYPIQSGIILIGLSLILFLFKLNSGKKSTNFWDLTPSNKKARISAWFFIISLFIVGLISILKNIL